MQEQTARQLGIDLQTLEQRLYQLRKRANHRAVGNKEVLAAKLFPCLREAEAVISQLEQALENHLLPSPDGFIRQPELELAGR